MHEKGGVEGEIGRFRRRHLTPVPHVGSLAALNKALAAADARRRHRRIGARIETVGAFPLPVVRPVLGFKPKITLIGPLDSAVPVELSDDALATLRESLSNVVPNAEVDAGTC